MPSKAQETPLDLKAFVELLRRLDEWLVRCHPQPRGMHAGHSATTQASHACRSAMLGGVPSLLQHVMQVSGASPQHSNRPPQSKSAMQVLASG